MSYFLWIEDFENSPKVTANDVFGGMLDEQSLSENAEQLKNALKKQGVFIELSFQDGLEFIRNKLSQIDYIILDIDLPAYSEGDDMNADISLFLKEHYGYDPNNDDEELLSEKCKAIKEIAGYHIYTELVVELGFPKEHILFCSNHGDNLKTIKEAFKIAKISLPDIHTKSDSSVKAWTLEKYEYQYSRLRRGIIEGCQYLSDLPESQWRFNKFIKKTENPVSIDELPDYLSVLESFLPLGEQKRKSNSSLYRLFIRVLAHEWEAAEPKKLEGQQEVYAFSAIMKMARNWSAHGNVFEHAKPQDVAYLFIVNMRAMFDLEPELLPYEKHLLQLFKGVTGQIEFRGIIGTDHEDRHIPLAENYANLLAKSGNTYQAIDFHTILNELQRKKLADDEFLMKGIYKIFWFLTSYGHVHVPYDMKRIKNFTNLKYQFKHFDYSKNEYLFDISRHIYNASFAEI